MTIQDRDEDKQEQGFWSGLFEAMAQGALWGFIWSLLAD
jgi:hypothetical protein